MTADLAMMPAHELVKLFKSRKASPVEATKAAIVRIDALKLLNSVEADSSVRIVLQKLAQSDKNVYIRSQAKAMVAQMPEMN